MGRWEDLIQQRALQQEIIDGSVFSIEDIFELNELSAEEAIFLLGILLGRIMYSIPEGKDKVAIRIHSLGMQKGMTELDEEED